MKENENSEKKDLHTHTRYGSLKKVFAMLNPCYKQSQGTGQRRHKCCAETKAQVKLLLNGTQHKYLCIYTNSNAPKVYWY